MDYTIVRSRLVDVLLTGHDHDLAIGYDGKTVMVESSEEGNFVTAIDFVATATGEGKDRKVDLGAELPRARFDHGRGRPGGAGGRQALRGRALEGTRRRYRHDRDRTRQPHRHRALAGGGDRQPHRRRDQGLDRRRRRHHQRRRHPRQQGLSRRARSCRAATSSPNCPSATRPPSSRSPAPRSRRRWRTASRSSSSSAGRFPQVSGLKFDVDPKAAGRLAHRERHGRTASPSTRRRSTRSRPTTSCSRAATATPPSPRAGS